MALERYLNFIYLVTFPNKYTKIQRKNMSFLLCFTIFLLLFRHKYIRTTITNQNLIVNEYGNQHYIDSHELRYSMYELRPNLYQSRVWNPAIECPCGWHYYYFAMEMNRFSMWLLWRHTRTHFKCKENVFKCVNVEIHLNDVLALHAANAIQNMISDSCNLLFALNKVWISIHDSIETNMAPHRHRHGHTGAHFEALILYWFSTVYQANISR